MSFLFPSISAERKSFNWKYCTISVEPSVGELLVHPHVDGWLLL
jgi:hypothetical protein